MLLEKINNDFVVAMKSKEESRISVLRMLKSAIQNEQIKIGHELTDQEITKVIQSQTKQRRDSIATYEAGGRAELAEKEKAEIEILSSYLPQQLSDDQLRAIIEKAIEETGASGKADMGKVMGKVMPEVGGQADGSSVSRIASELLN